MLTARAAIVAGAALVWVGCGSDSGGDAGDQLRAVAPSRAEVTISKFAPADPLPALRAQKRSARPPEQSQTPDQSASESAEPAPQQAEPAPQNQAPSTTKPSPSKPQSPSDSGGEDVILE